MSNSSEFDNVHIVKITIRLNTREAVDNIEDSTHSDGKAHTNHLL